MLFIGLASACVLMALLALPASPGGPAALVQEHSWGADLFERFSGESARVSIDHQLPTQGARSSAVTTSSLRVAVPITVEQKNSGARVSGNERRSLQGEPAFKANHHPDHLMMKRDRAEAQGAPPGPARERSTRGARGAQGHDHSDGNAACLGLAKTCASDGAHW
jgi:hypothetical protein